MIRVADSLQDRRIVAGAVDTRSKAVGNVLKVVTVIALKPLLAMACEGPYVKMGRKPGPQFLYRSDWIEQTLKSHRR